MSDYDEWMSFNQVFNWCVIGCVGGVVVAFVGLAALVFGGKP